MAGRNTAVGLVEGGQVTGGLPHRHAAGRFIDEPLDHRHPVVARTGHQAGLSIDDGSLERRRRRDDARHADERCGRAPDRALRLAERIARLERGEIDVEPGDLGMEAEERRRRADLDPRSVGSEADLAALTERVRRRVIRWFRMQRLLDAAAAADMLAWENSGFSVDASVGITLIDRDVPSYFQSLEHRHRYHGVFAPNHKLRRAVTSLAIGNVGKRQEAVTGGHWGDGHATEGCCDAHQKPRSHDTSRIAWAKLMARVGEEFPLECAGCGGDIRLRGDRRQEPAHFEPEVRKRKKARMASPA